MQVLLIYMCCAAQSRNVINDHVFHFCWIPLFNSNNYKSVLAKSRVDFFMSLRVLDFLVQPILNSGLAAIESTLWTERTKLETGPTDCIKLYQSIVDTR